MAEKGEKTSDLRFGHITFPQSQEGPGEADEDDFQEDGFEERGIELDTTADEPEFGTADPVRHMKDPPGERLNGQGEPMVKRLVEQEYRTPRGWYTKQCKERIDQ